MSRLTLTNAASSALLAIGVNTTELQFRGKLTFVAISGQPSATWSAIAPPYGNILVMDAVVPCMYTQVMISIIVCSQSFNIIHFHLFEARSCTHDINNNEALLPIFPAVHSINKINCM